MFDVEKFKHVLDTQWLGQSLLYFDKLESTNAYLKSLSSDQISHGLLCIADYQTRGRGQYERKWETSPGENLTFTLAFKPTVKNRFHVLTMACAASAVEQIIDTTGLPAQIKWPNDVYVKGKKVGGLLTETIFNGNKLDRVLVGIGLNVNQQAFSKDIRNKASSLYRLSENGKKYDLEAFLSDFLQRMEYSYGRWQKRNSDLIKQINKKIIGHGEWVRLNVNDTVRDEKAKLIGINEEGQLVVIDEEGGIETFSYEQIRLLTD